MSLATARSIGMSQKTDFEEIAERIPARHRTMINSFAPTRGLIPAEPRNWPVLWNWQSTSQRRPTLVKMPFPLPRQGDRSDLLAPHDESATARRTLASGTAVNEPTTAYQQARTLERLAGLETLEYDWDGEGALPIDHEIIQAAERLLRTLVPARNMPAIVPLPSGSVQFEWRSGNRLVELEFDSAINARYLKWKPGVVAEEDSISIANVPAILSLLSWLYQGE